MIMVTLVLPKGERHTAYFNQMPRVGELVIGEGLPDGRAPEVVRIVHVLGNPGHIEVYVR